jgi:nucleotide-binding universal stress UspA family protein
MYHRILVPLDGSRLAERVLPYATLLARKSAARLILVQAQGESLAQRVDPWVAVEPVNPVDQAAGATAHVPDAAATYLDGLAARLVDGGVAAEVFLVHGSGGDAIVRATREQGADLLALTTHGRSGLGRWLYGSVADHVLRHATIPVLLLPAGGTQPWDSESARRVLVPLDGSELAETALDPASTLARVLGAELVLVQAIEPGVSPASEVSGGPLVDPAPLLAAAGEYLEGVAAALRAQGHTVVTQSAVGHAWPVISAAASAQSAAGIAMATHGRSGLARLVLGSVATATLQHAVVPLLFVRPRALHGTGAAIHEPQPYDDEAPDVASGSSGSPARR